MWVAVATTSTDLPARTDTVSGRFERMDLTLSSAHVVKLAKPVAPGSTYAGYPRSSDGYERCGQPPGANPFLVVTHLHPKKVREPTALKETKP